MTYPPVPRSLSVLTLILLNEGDIRRFPIQWIHIPILTSSPMMTLNP